jgi:hypothetical protein
MTHEINVAALLREDTRTIAVAFPKGVDYPNQALAEGSMVDIEEFDKRYYAYVTDFDLKEGDAVLVEAAGSIKVAIVCKVDDTVKIDPGLQYELRWVIQKLDFSHHQENLIKNEEIKGLVQQAYQRNLRRSFAQQLLAGLDGSEEKEKLVALLGKA